MPNVFEKSKRLMIMTLLLLSASAFSDSSYLQVFGSSPYTDPNSENFGQSRFLLDEKNPLWDKPFTARDNQEGADYNDPINNHVTWTLKDIDSNLEDEVNDYVIQMNFGDSGASGVFYIGASNPIDLSGYSEGSLIMDIRVLDKPPGVEINYKVDHCYSGYDGFVYCDQGAGTGEMPLPLDSLISDFQTVRIPFCTLTNRGLDDVMVVSPMVIVPGQGGSANNVTLQIDNVYFDSTPSSINCDTNPPVDFENTEKIYPVGGFAGGVPSIVQNPHSDIINSSAEVLKIVKGAPSPSNALFGGAYLDFSNPLDFEQGSAFSIKLLAQEENLSLGVKLDSYNNNFGGPNNVSSETYIVSVNDVNQWVPVTFDFTGKVSNAADWTRLSFIINDGVAGTGDSSSTFYIDDIEQIDTGNMAFDWGNDVTVLDFDLPNTTYIINGWGGATGAVVTDPLDPNNLVGEHTRDFWDIVSLTAGPILGPFSNPIPVNSSVMYACMDVLSPSDTSYVLYDEDGDMIPPFVRQRDTTTEVSMRLEDAFDYYQHVSSSAVVQNTGEWQTLFFDFSTGLGASFPDQPTYVSANGDGSYERIALNFEGVGIITGLTYHFDNIEFIEDSNLDGVIDINDCGITPSDLDNDSIEDFIDNCPSVSNTGQDDLDDDGIGDACDNDADGDGFTSDHDYNDLNAYLSTDPDNDGVDSSGTSHYNDNVCLRSPQCNENDPCITVCYVPPQDNCPALANPDQSNIDGDAEGDACDLDIDGDLMRNTVEVAAGLDPNDPSDGDQAELSALEALGINKQVPAMGGIGLLALGLSMLGLGAVRLRE